MSLAKNIVRARKRRKMTQVDLARTLKKSKASVSEWESGKHAPRLPMLRRIAQVLDTPLEELLA